MLCCNSLACPPAGFQCAVSLYYAAGWKGPYTDQPIVLPTPSDQFNIEYTGNTCVPIIFSRSFARMMSSFNVSCRFPNLSPQQAVDHMATTSWLVNLFDTIPDANTGQAKSGNQFSISGTYLSDSCPNEGQATYKSSPCISGLGSGSVTQIWVAIRSTALLPFTPSGGTCNPTQGGCTWDNRAVALSLCNCPLIRPSELYPLGGVCISALGKFPPSPPSMFTSPPPPPPPSPGSG